MQAGVCVLVQKSGKFSRKDKIHLTDFESVVVDILALFQNSEMEGIDVQLFV